MKKDRVQTPVTEIIEALRSAKRIVAQHAIITPTCRANRSDIGAFEEAVARLRRQYEQSVEGWGDKANYHLKLEIERLESREEHGK